MDKDNDRLIEIDGVLYSHDKTKIVKYPADKQDEAFVVPDGVVEIGDRAFADAVHLRHVTLPPTVRIIGDYAFRGARFEVNIPASVTEVGIGAYARS